MNFDEAVVEALKDIINEHFWWYNNVKVTLIDFNDWEKNVRVEALVKNGSEVKSVSCDFSAKVVWKTMLAKSVLRFRDTLRES